MKTNLKKILPFFVLAGAALTAPAFAYDEDHEGNHNKTQHAVPPAQYPGGEDALSFFVGASYTYWVPYQTGMNVAFTNGSSSITGNIIRPSLDGRSGFKVELGANTHHDGWCGHVSYTWFWFDQKLKSRTTLVSTNYFSPFDDQNVAYNGAETQYKQQFNRIHGALDRAFYAGHYLAFRPWIGLLGAWEDQSLNFNMTQQANTSNTDQFRLRQNWWAVGPYSGVDCTYYLTNEWGLFLSAGGAMLYAEHKVDDDRNTLAAGSVTGTDHNIHTAFYNVEPMMETQMGLRWDSFWTDWALRIELAWELQTYFSHNGMLGVDEITGQMGDFSLQGLTLGLRVYF